MYVYAACPGGEEAVLKTVGSKGLAGSNPVRSVLGDWCNGITSDSESEDIGSIPVLPVYASVSQMDRVRGYELRCCRFKSCRKH